MILIDSLYINNGGGKILLDYLMKSLEKTDLNVYYLLDERIKNDYVIVKKTNHIKFMKASLFNRYVFYKKHQTIFSTILCFGNIPPNIKVDSRVFTYFHQPLFLEVPYNFSFVNKIKFKLKTNILSYFAKNTNFWLVQNESVKERLSNKYSINLKIIDTIPFYPSVKSSSIIKRNYTYLYVSNASPHKNHILLIKAFCNFYDKHKKGILTLTVNENFINVFKLIEEKIKNGYPIENLGFINQLNLAEVYGKSKYFICPSLAESFGLGLVEAIENGCDVIGADLPYMYVVCKPSLIFNPNDIYSIEAAFEKSLIKNNIKKTVSIIENQIDKLIELLKHENSK